MPQGSSVLYMLNQLGASVGIAVMALILQTTGRDVLTGFRTYAFVLGACAVILLASLALPAKALVSRAG